MLEIFFKSRPYLQKFAYHAFFLFLLFSPTIEYSVHFFH
jgi:hypothetical protein